MRLGFLTAHSLILTAGNGTSRKASAACLGRRRGLKRNEASRVCSPILPARTASLRPAMLALGANSCGNISWLETLARGTNAYCVEKGTSGTFLCPSAVFPRDGRIKKNRKKKNEKNQKRQKHLRGVSNSDLSARLTFRSVDSACRVERRKGWGQGLKPWAMDVADPCGLAERRTGCPAVDSIAGEF